jgi:class 3 adenylate cyclase/tetratricopeptide (TPR) repeat protein
VLTCGNCGRESPDDFAFCPVCGAPLVTPVEPHEVRKTVTVVFCDVTGSTAMGEKLDPESVRRVMSRYFSEMRTALERHGASVEKFIGDAVMAVFGVPQIHEDDALRAVRAAADMRQALILLNKELERDYGVTVAARIGVNTGDVVAGDPSGETLVTGDAVNVAARLEQAAAPGEVLIGPKTLRLVRDAVVADPIEPLELKGKSEPVAAFRLVEVMAGAPGVARRLDSPMVGRERQLRQLRQAFDTVAADRSCQLFTVIGAPGVGKSRLVEEFVRGLHGLATVLRGRCLPYGDGVTFFPVGEVMKEAAGLDDFDAPEEIERKICAVLGDGEAEACARLAQLFGLAGHDGTTDETLWAVRRFLESVAQSAPLAVVFDDVQWGEPTFLDLIESIADRSRDAPILVLVMARPDLLDERPAWGGGKPNAATISLEPLSVEECDALMANLLGRAALPDDARTRIFQAAEGTPLFVEEMLSMLIDDGLLVRGDRDWTAIGDLSAVPVPATVQALLAARLDRLGAEERAVIEYASVAGQQFHVGALEAMSAGRSLDVRRALRGLVRRDLIRPDRSLLAGDDAFRFRHLLIRDAAYEAILKSARAELHARFAEWLERVAGDRIEEQEEILGYHLERAYRLREDLGPIDDATRGMGLRAAAHLGASGRRASERGDVAAAANLFRRATDLLPVGSAERPQLLYELGGAMIEVGDVRLSFSASEQASTEAAAAGQISLDWLARIQRTWALAMMEPHAASTEDARVELEAAILVFEGLGDEAGLANAWLGLSDIAWMPCRFEDAERAAERSAEHARRAGDRRLLERALWRRTAAQYLGATPPAEALEAVSTAVEEIGGMGGFRHIATAIRGACLALRGDLDGARRLLDEADAIAEALGSGQLVTIGLECRGEVEFLAGDIAAAERAIREAFRLTDELGDEGHKSTIAGNLARALAHLGRFDEAESYAKIAIETAAEDDLASQIQGRVAEARVRSARGRHDEAIALARESVEMFADAQDPRGQGDVCMELAEVLRAAGRPDEAAEAARRGLGYYERKESVPATKAARAFLASLGETQPGRT